MGQSQNYRVTVTSQCGRVVIFVQGGSLEKNIKMQFDVTTIIYSFLPVNTDLVSPKAIDSGQMQENLKLQFCFKIKSL